MFKKVIKEVPKKELPLMEKLLEELQEELFRASGIKFTYKIKHDVIILKCDDENDLETATSSFAFKYNLMYKTIGDMLKERR